MASWFLADYVFVSFVGHFEERYGIALAVPPVAATILLIVRLVRAPWGAPLPLAGAALAFAICLVASPVTGLAGFGPVAEAVLKNARQDDVVLFHLYETKSLTFSLRTHSPRPKVYVLRSEKFLVDYSIIREWSIKDRNLSAEDIDALLTKSNISLVVLQPGFWADQPSMARLQTVVMSDRFEHISDFRTTAPEPNRATDLKLFRIKQAGAEQPSVPRP